MRKLQDDAKPILSPLLGGEWGNIDAKQAAIIAAWAAMTVMNIDAATFESRAVTHEDRHYLRVNSRAPSNIRFWMGRVSSVPNLAYAHIQWRIGSINDKGEGGASRNAAQTTMKLGQLLLQSYYSSVGGINFSNEAYGHAFGVLPLHPEWSGGAVDLHRAPILTTQDVDDLEQAIPRKLRGRIL